MDLDKIREQLTIAISSSQEWLSELQSSDPGHYGIVDWDVHLAKKDLWVDIPTKTFNFKNARFDFEVLIGGSDGVPMEFSKTAKGTGTFMFEGKEETTIDELNLDFDLDLFGEQR